MASVTAAAHGRVNLIGEHTDYNGGFVLPTAIPQQTRVTLTSRQDRTVHARSRDAEPAATYQLGREQKRGDWADYVQGITWALATSGHASNLRGFDLEVESDVPLGGGVSSSAALEVALLRGLRSAFELQIDDVELARLGQLAENEFVGARCGIMDQMAASLADTETALFLDTRSLEFRRIPLPAGADLIVIHSGISHGIAGGEYNQRRADCEAAAAMLGVPQLRDLTSADMPAIEGLPERLMRRARHVVTEDERVLAAVDTIEAGDLPTLGRLFYESHASMRDDFEVSIPEIDLLVELAHDEQDVFGARLTGGGFGGAVVALARGGSGRDVAERLAAEYAQQSSMQPRILVP
jgi:galactokinase